MKRWTRKTVALVALGGMFGLLAGCGEGLDDAGEANGAVDGAAGQAGDAGGDGNGEWPETVTYGVLPTSDEVNLASLYTPFEDYMQACLDHPFELFTGTNYTAMIEAMRTGNIHMSKFGPFAYILAAERAGADALVQPLDDADEPFYTAQIVTLESYGFESLDDLEGEPFAFVDAASTSGHLFPRAMMVDELGISNDDVESWLGEVVFSGGHDASILSVLNGDVAASAISSNAWVLQVEGGQFDDHANIDDLVILAETDDIPRTVEAVQGDLPQDLQDALEACFVAAIDEPDLEVFFE
jgi:phosphonate transport system substrate-binding protein